MKILYAQLANLSETIVYRWDDLARLRFARSLNNPHSFLPCWTHVNIAGTRMYTGNAGSDNISVFDIARDATEAARAMRGHNERAEGKYLDEANDAMTVMGWRRRHLH